MYKATFKNRKHIEKKYINQRWISLWNFHLQNNEPPKKENRLKEKKCIKERWISLWNFSLKGGGYFGVKEISLCDFLFFWKYKFSNIENRNKKRNVSIIGKYFFEIFTF